MGRPGIAVLRTGAVGFNGTELRTGASGLRGCWWRSGNGVSKREYGMRHKRQDVSAITRHPSPTNSSSETQPLNTHRHARMTHRVDVVSRIGRLYVAVAALATVYAAVRVRAAARVVCLLAPRLRSERVGLRGTKCLSIPCLE